MSGFPLRISRKALGPVMANIPPANPTTDIGGPQFNLMWWQLSGCNGLVPLAWMLVQGSDGSRLSSFEAWNPNDDNTLYGVPARSSAGRYTVSYETEYEDETGTLQPLTLVAGEKELQTTDPTLKASVSVALNGGGNLWVATIVVNDSSNAPIDCNVLLKVR